MKILVLISTLFLAIPIFGQSYLLPNETAIYSFSTNNGKQIMLAKDTLNVYMVYRFGTKNKIEFEYPNNLKESWKKFKYSFYMRGGGAMNEGMDLNYIYFENKGFTYVIYDTYYAVGEKSSVGIKIID